MKLIYLKSALKCNSFDVAIGIKIPFFRVLITIEPGRSLQQFVTTNCLIMALVVLFETFFWKWFLVQKNFFLLNCIVLFLVGGGVHTLFSSGDGVIWEALEMDFNYIFCLGRRFKTKKNCCSYFTLDI